MSVKLIREDAELRSLILETMDKARAQRLTPESLCDYMGVLDAQHYYWWCMDMKVEERAKDLFSDEFSYHCFGPQNVSADEQIERSKSVNAPMVTSHMGHQPMLWLKSATEARGIFRYEDDHVYVDGDKERVRSWAVYVNDFVKGEDGLWRISALRLSYSKMEGKYRL